MSALDLGPLNAFAAENDLPPAIVEAVENELADRGSPGICYPANDAGRAEEFVDRTHKDLRYVPAWNRWLVWAGHYWRPDEDGEITRLVVKHSRQLMREAAEIPDEIQRGFAIKAAVALGNAGRIQNTLELAKCDSRVVASHRAMDGNPFLLGVQNGVIELRTGTFRTGKREDLITKLAGVTYQKSASCPRWLAFLNEVLQGDAELIGYLQKLVGYTLTGDVSAQMFPFLYGTGKNGKSVFTEILQKLLGDYGRRAPQSLLTESPNGREPSGEIARLQGARLVIGSETTEGGRLAESRIKDLTGGDTMTGRFLYCESFDFKPALKLWMFGNHKPGIRGTDEGIWRRVRLIPFTVCIPEERRDPQLTEKLIAELPGILLWALEGTHRWLTSGLTTPAIVRAASDEYRADEDTLGEFLDDETEGATGIRTPLAEMFARYKGWAERSGIRHLLTLKALNKRLTERGFVQGRQNGSRHWEGVSLR